MNALNLKITGDTKKKGKKREAPEDLSVFYFHHKDACKSVIDMLSSASTMESQILSLKSVISTSLNDLLETSDSEGLPSPTSDARDLVKLFLDMVLKLNSRSPLKAAIIRHFSTVSEPQKGVVESILINFIEEQSIALDYQVEVVNQYVQFISTWLECGMFSLGQTAEDTIINRLEKSLFSLQSDSHSFMPPTSKLQVLEALHNAVRCLMSVFQKTSSRPISSLEHLVLSLLRDDQLPLDTRSNCGILYVMMLKHSRPDFQAAELLDALCSPDECQSILCLCNGLLNVLSGQHLEKPVIFHREERSLLHHLLYKITLVEDSNPSDCTLVLSASRCVLLVTKCIISWPSLLSERVLLCILNTLWIHLEHYMDAVRHLASSSLTNIVSAGKILEGTFAFDILSNEMTKIPSDKRSKHAAISVLIGNLPVQTLLAKSPGLVNALLESAVVSPSRNHAIGSYEALMTQHFQEKFDMEEWYNCWVNPLISVFGDYPNAALEHILAAIVKIEPTVIHYINRLRKDKPEMFNCIFLISLKIGKKLGVLKISNEQHNLTGLIDYDMIAENVYHSNGEIRIACFAILVEDQKLTEEFSSKELDIIKLFLKHNINNHCAAERQKTLAYFKKFLSRFKTSLEATKRMIEKEEKKPPNVAPSKNLPALKARVELYKRFHTWLVQFCIDNLFPGASFARRGLALNLLSFSQEHGLWDDGCQTEGNCSTLLYCFLDSYEENKNLAKKLLAEVPPESLKFNSSDHLKWYLDSSIRLAASVRPIDSQSAAYFISLLANFPTLGSSLMDAYADSLNLQEIDVTAIPSVERYLCLRIALQKLRKELEVARCSLLKAAASSPMYGQLFVLRHVLKDADFSLIQGSTDWKQLVQEIVSVAYDCNDVVSSVVNSSSPEGHLPMDFDYDLQDLGRTDGTPKVTAQMVLLCSWRTVKEVSLLLGELSETAPISTNGEPGLVTEHQILEIGEHLSTLLAETKHRGAFEQAYVGFCKLVSRLWRFPHGNLHELPSRWLEETLDEISNNQNLSATRRSAGIPFRIQALVCTELEVGGGKCFHKGIKVLLKLAGDPSNSVETKCHALNILRALYRHTLLGEMVSPYVAEGLTIAIQGFNASTWAERNSSTLLLSALMTRVFGVPRSRSDDLCWKNKMTGRIFFQRYPSLFSVLLDHLKAASEKPLYPATYPALLILGRLYPSSLEGTDSNLQLNKYIPLVFKCSGSNILKTRTLAASAMVALVTPNLFISHIDEVFQSLAGSLSENFTHGLLLQVLKLFRSSNHLPEDVLGSIKTNLDLWATHVIDTMTAKKRSYVTKTTCTSILLHWISCFFPSIPSDIVRKIKKVVFSEITSEDPCRVYYGRSVFLLHAATLMLTINYNRKNVDDTLKDLILLLRHGDYDVRNVTLDFVRCVLLECKSFTLKVDDASDIKFACSDFDRKLREKILHSVDIAEGVLARIGKGYGDDMKDRYHHEDALELLSVACCLPKVFDLLNAKGLSPVQYFNELCENKPESLRAVAFSCISSYLSSNGVEGLSLMDIQVLCKLLDIYSLSDSENSCRSEVASFLGSNFKNLIKISSSENSLSVWTATLRLLMDDDADIRNALSSAFATDCLSSVAVDKFFALLVESVNLDDLTKCCLLLQWSMWDCNADCTADDESSDRVFEKGDMNTYLEEFKINELACAHLESLVSANTALLTEKMPAFLSEWISSESGFSLAGNTISEIVVSFKTYAEEISLKTFKQSPFRQNESNLLLMQRKLDRIMDCTLKFSSSS